MPRKSYHFRLNFATNANASLIDATTQILLNNNLIENTPTYKGDSFFIKYTSRDIHEVSCVEKTPQL